MTIPHAAATRELLLTALSAGEETLTLDMSGIEAIDSAGLQLLIGAQRSLERQGRALAIDGMPPVVREAMGLFGLQTLLRCKTGSAA